MMDRRLSTGLLLALGFITLLGSATLSLVGASPLHKDDPVLVVTLPWDDSPGDVVKLAGGAVIGPVEAPMAVLASGATVAEYKAAGAIAVLSAATLALFCES